ncbi:uncharacterized protein LOC135215931 [Macrobrachium nipponense]|uniref:uncharacterized protein LOC135215931 n=1 Tax=Macrobrachium nipponense TaxID=159736 RepID=UPI0030C82072
MASASLIFLCFVGSVIVSLASGCSSPYQKVGQWCIFVNITAPAGGPGQPVSWLQAKASCQQSNADLVTLEDQRKLFAITQYLNLNFRSESQGGWVYWVGALGSNREWQWVNNKPLSLLLKYVSIPYLNHVKLRNQLGKVIIIFSRFLFRDLGIVPTGCQTNPPWNPPRNMVVWYLPIRFTGGDTS